MFINIIKSFRKTLSLKVKSESVLEVRAPKFCSQKQIDDFIKKSQNWIQKQQEKLRNQNSEKKLFLLGKIFDNSENLNTEELEKFYKLEAKKYISLRCKELAEKHNFSYNTLRITSAMTRWGSCSSNRNINFSYRLIMTPSDCIDYVIIHELCHLRQMNHSPKFWSEVGAIMPDYKIQEQHLKKYSFQYKI